MEPQQGQTGLVVFELFHDDAIHQQQVFVLETVDRASSKLEGCRCNSAANGCGLWNSSTTCIRRSCPTDPMELQRHSFKAQGSRRFAPESFFLYRCCRPSLCFAQLWHTLVASSKMAKTTLLLLMLMCCWCHPPGHAATKVHTFAPPTFEPNVFAPALPTMFVIDCMCLQLPPFSVWSVSRRKRNQLVHMVHGNLTASSNPRVAVHP